MRKSASQSTVVASPAIPNVSAMRAKIQRILRFSTFEPDQRYWMKTGSRRLDATFGSSTDGIPYGKLMEISGIEHGGKTLIVTYLAGLAQQAGAAVGYIDLEDSHDAMWAKKLGLDLDSVYLISPKLVRKKKRKKTPARIAKAKAAAETQDAADKKSPALELQSAEDLLVEAEAAMTLYSAEGFTRQFWMVDSIAMLQPDEMLEAGTDGQNMRTRSMSRASLLATTLPKWVALAANYNSLIVFINQIRMNPNVRYGNPETTPGGKAIRHCCHIRASVKRIKNGVQRNGGRIVGIVGKIVNIKNKAGEGSIQGDTCGFRVLWNKMKAQVNFMSVEEAEKLIKGE